jgi:hypothetical protein
VLGLMRPPNFQPALSWRLQAVTLIGWFITLIGLFIAAFVTIAGLYLSPPN